MVPAHNVNKFEPLTPYYARVQHIAMHRFTVYFTTLRWNELHDCIMESRPRPMSRTDLFTSQAALHSTLYTLHYTLYTLRGLARNSVNLAATVLKTLQELENAALKTSYWLSRRKVFFSKICHYYYCHYCYCHNCH